MSDLPPLQPPSPPAEEAVALRPYRPEDGPWIAERHGALYHQEFGWDLAFADLVSGILADMERQFDPARERCWIAERGNERLGCVALLRDWEQDGVAKLRILLVDPAARGLGLGEQLVAACTAFAREAGYHTITLWTVSSLGAARRLYERAGYQLVAMEPEHAFGQDLVNETWELPLTQQGCRHDRRRGQTCRGLESRSVREVPGRAGTALLRPAGAGAAAARHAGG